MLPQILPSASNNILTTDKSTARCQSHRISKASSQSSKTSGTTNFCLNLPPIVTFPVPDYIHAWISPQYISSDSEILSGGYWFQAQVTSINTESGPIKCSLVDNLVYPHYSTAILPFRCSEHLQVNFASNFFVKNWFYF